MKKKNKLYNLITNITSDPKAPIQPDLFISQNQTQTKARVTSIFRVHTTKKYKSVLAPEQQQDHKQESFTNLSQQFQKKQYNSSTQQKNLQKIPTKKTFTTRFTNNQYLTNLPLINQSKNLEQSKSKYYTTTLIKALSNVQMSYFLRLYRIHFQQCIKAANNTKFAKNISQPSKKLNLPKPSQKQKTIIFDLDQTLIHCTQSINFKSIRLKIPLQNGMSVMAGINIRPHCRELLREISSIAQIMIFTASSSLYADVVLDYLDPEKKYISHRLYRHHCTLQKGYYIKDLRIINRNIDNMVIVDNSYYSFCLQPQNGIPIIPYYDNGKDHELIRLLEYLKQLVIQQNMREKNKKTFILDRYRQLDIRNIILNKY